MINPSLNLSQIRNSKTFNKLEKEVLKKLSGKDVELMVENINFYGYIKAAKLHHILFDSTVLGTTINNLVLKHHLYVEVFAQTFVNDLPKYELQSFCNNIDRLDCIGN